MKGWCWLIFSGKLKIPMGLIRGWPVLIRLLNSLRRMSCFICFTISIRIGWSMCWKSMPGPSLIVWLRRSFCMCSPWTGRCWRICLTRMRKWSTGSVYWTLRPGHSWRRYSTLWTHSGTKPSTSARFSTSWKPATLIPTLFTPQSFSSHKFNAFTLSKRSFLTLSISFRSSRKYNGRTSSKPSWTSIIRKNRRWMRFSRNIWKRLRFYWTVTTFWLTRGWLMCWRVFLRSVPSSVSSLWIRSLLVIKYWNVLSWGSSLKTPLGKRPIFTVDILI